MEVTVEHLGAVQFAIKARKHSIVSDQPAENGGFDEGMTPPELFASALGSCAGFYAAHYLKKKGLVPQGTVVACLRRRRRIPRYSIILRSKWTCPPQWTKSIARA